MPSKRQANVRHAGFYCGILKHTDELYLQGGASIAQALLVFDAEVANIRAAQAWSTRMLGGDVKSRQLCSHFALYGRYCAELRLPLNEQHDWVAAGLDAALRMGVDIEVAPHLANLGVVEFSLGQETTATTHLLQSLDIIRRYGDRQREGAVLVHLSNVHNHAGRVVESRHCIRRALRIARAIQDEWAVGIALDGVGHLYQAQGQHRRAKHCYCLRLELARAGADNHSEANALGNVANCHHELGELDSARACYEQALGLFSPMGDKRSIAKTAWNLAQLLEALGNLSEAIAYGNQARICYDDIGDAKADIVRKKVDQWRTALNT